MAGENYYSGGVTRYFRHKVSYLSCLVNGKTNSVNVGGSVKNFENQPVARRVLLFSRTKNESGNYRFLGEFLSDVLTGEFLGTIHVGDERELFAVAFPEPDDGSVNAKVLDRIVIPVP